MIASIDNSADCAFTCQLYFSFCLVFGTYLPDSTTINKNSGSAFIAYSQMSVFGFDFCLLATGRSTGAFYDDTILTRGSKMFTMAEKGRTTIHVEKV